MQTKACSPEYSTVFSLIGRSQPTQAPCESNEWPMGGLNNNAVGLKSNQTMVLYVDFVCGVCPTNQVHDEKDASCFD